MNVTEVSVEMHPEELAAVLRDPALGAHLLAAAEPTVVRSARMLAPQRTGAGAASITGKIDRHAEGEVVVRVSWDRAHYYMGFQDGGTAFVPAVYFLRRAAADWGGPPAPSPGPRTTWSPRSHPGVRRTKHRRRS